MKINFLIDLNKKEVTFFVKQGHLKEWVLKSRNNLPEISDQELASNGARYLAQSMVSSLELISKKVKLDLLAFQPNLVFYKRKYELPPKIKRVSS